MRRSLGWTVGMLMGCAVLVSGPAAFGQSSGSAEEGTWSIGFYGGTYAPGPDELDDQTTYGIRVGYGITPHWFVSGSLGRVSTESEELPAGLSGEVETDFTLLDFSGGYVFFKPERIFRLSLLAGIGGAWASADGELTDTASGATVVFEDLEADGFTVHAGIGPIIRLHKKVYLRVLTRFRYFDDREEDNVDREITLGIGFPLGK